MATEELRALACGCLVSGPRVLKWCKVHIDNQVKEGDALDLYTKSLTHSTLCKTCQFVCNIGDCYNSIAVYFPYGHRYDSLADGDEPTNFCSDKCLIEYLKRI